MVIKNKKDKSKMIVKECYEISKNDQKLLELVNKAKEIVFREDKILFNELAKH